MELEADSRHISTPSDEACTAEIKLRAGPAFVSNDMLQNLRSKWRPRPERLEAVR